MADHVNVLVAGCRGSQINAQGLSLEPFRFNNLRTRNHYKFKNNLTPKTLDRYAITKNRFKY